MCAFSTSSTRFLERAVSSDAGGGLPQVSKLESNGQSPSNSAVQYRAPFNRFGGWCILGEWLRPPCKIMMTTILGFSPWQRRISWESTPCFSGLGARKDGFLGKWLRCWTHTEECAGAAGVNDSVGTWCHAVRSRSLQTGAAPVLKSVARLHQARLHKKKLELGSFRWRGVLAV